MRRPFSSYNPLFYSVSVLIHRTRRRLDWYFGSQRFARTRSRTPLPYRVYHHQSVLVRKLGDVNPTLQYNKITNICLALDHLDGLLIRPGETFSFCYLVGPMTRRRGYLEGVLLRNGEAFAGIGGGICQIANLIHWLCLHSPLTVTEHHHHGFDPFPDSGRVVPFGCGASIFYNYLDYQFRNDTPYTFQLRFALDSKYLRGDLRVDRELPSVYHIEEHNHFFLRLGDRYYRTNEIWRREIDRVSGNLRSDRLLMRNFSLVKYIPTAVTPFDRLPPEVQRLAREKAARLDIPL